MNKDLKVANNTKRLEELWAGEFGNNYNIRNGNVDEKRKEFWHELLDSISIQNILEVGCNIGGNLQWMHPQLAWKNIYGIDVNLEALQSVHKNFPDINATHSTAQNLPFEDGSFDIVFTAGVLIHQPEESLPLVMNEMVRCSKKYVLCMEYFAETTEEVPYRDQEGALFRRNYGKLFTDTFPQLSLEREGYLTPEEGWDRITWWLFQKS